MERRSVRGLALGACGDGGVMALLSGCGGLTDQGRQRRQRQAAVRGQVRLLPHPRPRRHQGRDRARTWTQAFARAREDGFGESTFEGIVHRQIGQPARRPQVDPGDGQGAAADAGQPRQGRGRAGRRGLRRLRGRQGRQGHRRARAGRRRRGQGHGQGEERQARDPGRPGRRARVRVRQRRGARRPARDRLAERVVGPARHRDRGQRRQRERRGRLQRRRLEDQRRPQGRRVRVLLHASPATARPAWRARSPSSERGRGAPDVRRRTSSPSSIQASPFYLLAAVVAVRARTLAREGRPVPTGRLRADRRRRGGRGGRRPAADRHGVRRAALDPHGPAHADRGRRGVPDRDRR